MSENDESHFVFLTFTLRTNRRLLCLTGCVYNAFIIKGLQMKPSDSCKIQVMVS